MRTLLKHWKRKWESKAIVLMYHRITKLTCDPWQLAVSPEHFEEQIQLLREKFQVVSLAELCEQLKDGNLKHRSVAITFDDGFVDNFQIAYPILNDYRVPASFYITTNLVGTNEVFWWDQLQSIFLQTFQLPEMCICLIGDEPIELPTGNGGILSAEMKSQLLTWQAEQPPPNDRARCYYEVWKRVRVMADGPRRTVLQQLARWASLSLQANDSDRIVNARELNVIAENPLMEIGCHTCSHPALAEHTDMTQRNELELSKQQLEKWIGKSVTGLAYPHGSYNGTTIRIAEELGFRYAVTTETMVASKGVRLMEIPRVQVMDVSGMELQLQLQTFF